jgi:hypothetical protein
MVAHLTGLKLNYYLIVLATSVNVLLGLVEFVNLVGIRFYYFYSSQIVNIVFFSPAIDLWIWSVTLLFIVADIFLMKELCGLSFPRWTILPCSLALVSFAILALNPLAAFFAIPLGFVLVGIWIYYGNGLLVARRDETILLILRVVAGLSVLVEWTSLLSWLLNVFSYEAPFSGSVRWKFPLVDLQIFSILYPLTPALFLAFLYSWLWIPALNMLFSRISVLKNKLFAINGEDVLVFQIWGREFSRKTLAVALFLSSATAVFVACYSFVHLPVSTLVGADSAFYYDSLKEMAQKGPLVAFEKDRPLFNLLMYFFGNVTASSPEIVVRIMPVVLALCLCLAVFWFVRVGTKNDQLALISSVFSSFSFQMSVGVFAYFAANWLAIVEIFVLLVFLLKSLEQHALRYLLLSMIAGIAVLLTHPYTWYVLMAILLAYLVWTFLERKSTKTFDIKGLSLFLAVNLVFFVIYAMTPAGRGVSGSQTIFSSATSNAQILDLSYLLNGLSAMVQLYVGGLFGNPLLLVLAVCGMFCVFDFARRFNRLLFLWIIVPSVLFLIVPADPFYYRVMYLLPFQVLAAAGLCWIVSRLRGFFMNSGTREALVNFVTVLAMLFLLNYSLRSASEALIHLLQT